MRFDVSSLTDVGRITRSATPQDYALGQNYPNPFNPATTITFALRNTGPATVKVYDLLGREVATLFDAVATARTSYSLSFDATNLPSGMYFYTLRSEGRKRSAEDGRGEMTSDALRIIRTPTFLPVARTLLLMLLLMLAAATASRPAPPDEQHARERRARPAGFHLERQRDVIARPERPVRGGGRFRDGKTLRRGPVQQPGAAVGICHQDEQRLVGRGGAGPAGFFHALERPFSDKNE